MEALTVQSVTREPLAPPSVEERRALVHRVAASEQFSRATRLRDFLVYVGKQSLREGSPEVHEQEIGEKVFGRPEGYDRSQDNIVRVNATELRKRIDSFFANEGISEPLIFEIPRGGYKLTFRWRVATPAPAVQSQMEAVLVEPAAKPRLSWRALLASRLLWVLLTLFFAIAAVDNYLQLRAVEQKLHPWKAMPVVASFWQDFLDGPLQTDIILPDSSISLNEEITRHPIALNDYLSHSYVDQIRTSSYGVDRKTDLEGIFSHNLITFGDVRAAQHILALDPASTNLRLTTARFYNADSVKNHNLILIGGKKANPWAFLFEDQMNFSLDQDNDTLLMFVTDRKPLAGENTRYSEHTASKGPVGYSIVGYLPNPSHNGSAIVLAGTSSEATNAAAEFLSSEEQMEQLLKVLHAKSFPHFEVLLRTSQLSGTSFHAELVAYRTYPNQ